jgi:excisionase family DNA binding protein
VGGVRTNRTQENAGAVAPPTRSDLPQLVSILDVARMLGCGRNRAYELVNSGVLPFVQLGGVRKVDVRDVAAFVDREKQRAA